MSRAVFPREGWITFGNPNHYSGDGLMLREFRARARDPDATQLADCVRDLEADFLKENGQALTEKNAGVFGCGVSDQIADYLSDAAPEGYVFEIRKNRGNSNYGYFRSSGLGGEGDVEDAWITREELVKKLRENYGEAGVYALETSDVGDHDLDCGYDHCVAMILPALEEEMMSEESEQ